MIFFGKKDINNIQLILEVSHDVRRNILYKYGTKLLSIQDLTLSKLFLRICAPTEFDIDRPKKQIELENSVYTRDTILKN